MAWMTLGGAWKVRIWPSRSSANELASDAGMQDAMCSRTLSTCTASLLASSGSMIVSETMSGDQALKVRLIWCGGRCTRLRVLDGVPALDDEVDVNVLLAVARYFGQKSPRALDVGLDGVLERIAQRLLQPLALGHERADPLQISSKLAIDVLQNEPHAPLGAATPVGEGVNGEVSCLRARSHSFMGLVASAYL